MARYRYRCQECKKTFERVERMSEHDKRPVLCPKCKSKKVTRVIGAPFIKTSKKS